MILVATNQVTAGTAQSDSIFFVVIFFFKPPDQQQQKKTAPTHISPT